MNVLRLLLAALIIYVPNQALFKIEFTIKGLNVINVMFLLCLLLMMVLKVRARTPVPLKGVFYFFFAMLVWGFLAGVAQDSSEWVNDLTMLKNSIFYMLLYFLFYHAVQDQRTMRFLLATVLFVTFVASVQGLRQALDYGIAVYNETRRVSAPFGWSYTNANRSAVFFVIFIPLFGSIALFYRSKPLYRLVALGCVALGAFVVFFTYSRQAYFILAVIALLLALRRSLFVTALIVVALLTFESWAPESAVARIKMTSQSEESGAVPSADGEQQYDESTESRFLIWEGAAQLIAERPWGVGLNHFKREIGAYAPTFRNMDAHNFYVLITTEAGLIGPVATLALLFGLYRLARRIKRLDQTDESQALGTGFMMSVLAVAMGNIYGSRFLDGDVMGNFWILAGLSARYYTLSLESREKAIVDPRRPAVARGDPMSNPSRSRAQPHCRM